MISDRLVCARDIIGDSDELIEARLFQLDQHVVDVLVLKACDKDFLLHLSQYPNNGNDADSLAGAWHTEHHMEVVRKDALDYCLLLLFVETLQLMSESCL